MKKIFLIDSEDKDDFRFLSQVQESAYQICELKLKDLPSAPELLFHDNDIAVYPYDEKKFACYCGILSAIADKASLIFVVRHSCNEFFQDMKHISNSWYLKEPFEREEFDFILDMIGKNKCTKNSLKDCNNFSGTDASSAASDLLIKNEIFDTAYEYAPIPILVIDENISVERINRVGIEIIGKNPDKILGHLSGDVLSCVNSFKGKGCGTTNGCTCCPIRSIVGNTLRKGAGYHNIESSLDIVHDDGTVSTNYFLISTAYVKAEGNGRVILYLDDTTRRKKAENTLKESEERFQVLYENMPGGTLIIGEDYVIEDVNPRTCEITGYRREELVGQLCDIVCPKGSLSKKCPIWIDGLDGFQGMDTAIKCKDGRKTPILKNTKKIFIDGRQYILENFQDISDRKQAEEAIINAKISAEEANRTKSEFLATMSHELRTPLNAVIGYSDILLEDTFGKLNDQQRKSLTYISNSGKHLLRLINDILDLSKVESGKMELNYDQVHVRDLFSDVLNIVSPLARKKNIEISTEVVPENMYVNADKIRLKQILFNLASNAVKFTPEDGHVTLEAHTEGKVKKISVIDTGIGISEENIARLFLPFQQIDSTISRKYDGTGLGLSLVKRFAEMHGGEVTVESQVGKGSKFTVILPDSIYKNV